MATSTIHKPNDKLFKLAMAEIAVAKEFFDARLPKLIREKIDLKTLKLEKESFIDPAFKETEADVVYSVMSSNGTAYLYLLVEQQSTVDSMLAFRLLVYIVRILEQHLKQNPGSHLPLVYTMVIYAGDEPWDAALDIFPLFGELEELARETLLKPYQLMDVNRISDEELREQILSGLVAFALKHRKMANFKQFLEALMPWVHEVEIQGRHGVFLSRTVLKYVIAGTQQGDKDLLIQEAQRHLSSELQGEIMTIAKQWKEEGIQQGIQQGEATILMRLIRRRFGDLPQPLAQQIIKADTETLLLWGDKILEATNLEEIFTGE